MIGTGLHRRKFAGFDADAQALFDRMTATPDNIRKNIINDLIVGLRDDGNWDLIDVLVVLAAADPQASLLDWKDLSDGAAVNAPGFTVDRGATGDGIAAYINTQFNPSTDGVNYTQNSASAFAYCRTELAAGGQSIFGLKGAGGDGTLLNPRNATNNMPSFINSDTFLITANMSSLGLFSVNRVVNNLHEGLINGVSEGTQADTSQALLNGDFFVLGENQLGTGLVNPTTRQIALYGLGSGAVNHLEVFNRVQTYMTAIGAQV